ncbi:peptidase C14, caspase domain-containing protein [Desarmillaria tabescens]|uniref:Peptidase C14, caspase domain-containing protein n=1 Tax=Armillaria tabescens TaxID=1929756 RepID=A0AA39JYN7_ARMTA|nr:peptidase C14, caspase domain-containing protein [Desarmillaria tabescens]KAK0451178.1 peptidase C14, caspase domain-containing protein [Desarmillaria tabescens]
MDELSLTTIQETALGTSPQKKALIVAIGKTSSPGLAELRCPHRDAINISQLLIDVYGYKAENVVTLLDSSDGDSRRKFKQPTRKNLISHMKVLTHDAQPGDRFFFYFSGHSTQQNNESGTEEDGQDEYLVTKSGSCIRDNDLRKYLVEPLPAGCQLTAVLDTCHSGSLLDLPHYRCNRVFGRRRSESWWKVLTNESDGPSEPEDDISNSQREIELQALIDKIDANEEESDTDTDSDEYIFNVRGKMCLSPDTDRFCSGFCKASCESPKGANVVCLSSCKDSQSTLEIKGKGYSMTNVLIEYCRRQPHPTLKELMLHVIQETRKMTTGQRQTYAKEVKAWCQKHGPIPPSHSPAIKEYLDKNMKQDPQLFSDPNPVDMEKVCWAP